ncbi:MAG: TonB-dependent receptor plug [Chitinophagaceae bacterium]|nr:TonB-dependent receptor plug [Chitinophagaceae bacterium]
MRFFITFFFSFFLFLNSFSQTGKVEGKVTDSKTGNTLSGVSVTTSVSAKGTATNVDGRFVITLNAGTYTIRLTSVGYKIKEIDGVEVTAGTVINLDVVLESAAKTETEVVVKSSRRLESTAALISYQKNANTVAQVVSSESIRRSPDKNTGEVLKRVSGTSIQDGKYLVVRGLADRYNQAMLNGILLSSTEPDRKTFSFDIFPASTIDNIIINKAFLPELPGEWAGGLIQVNTKDVPAANFLNVQIGTGFNTQTAGSDFYKYQGGKTDFLGYDDGTRSMPADLPLKSAFNNLDQTQKTGFGKEFKNEWGTSKNNNNLLNQTLQIGGGFSTKLGDKNKLGVVLGVNYNRSVRRTEFENRIFSISNNIASLNFDYFNNKYSQDVLLGALGNITLQLGNNNKISFKNILNVNTTDYTTLRTGKDFESNSIVGDNIMASELAFKANTFFNTQVSGDHNFPALKAKLHWYGSFNILDQYIPDQRRIQYNQDDPTNPGSPYSLLISSSKTSQKSGSRYYGSLSDYIYTTGGDVSKSFTVKGLSQTIKGGYFLQIKDRLFDSRPFSIYLPSDNPALKHLSADVVFSPANFGTGFDNKFAFNEIYDSRYRYLANSILNAGFLQFDNQFSNKLRFVWGLRVENFDQLIGSTKKSDSRFVYSKITDFLPGANLTYKLNDKTNMRVSGSQTVVRPEFRELSGFAFYDFDLGATVTGSPILQRTKITNGDLRYEIYPKAGELFTLGVFYKYFDKPIELFFNQTGAGSSSTFNYINAENAKSYGAEFEFRKKLDFTPAFKNFTLQGNLSYIYNRVTGLSRPMQGQSPYLVNLGLQYDVEKLGLNTTLLFNQIGRRIYYVGSTSSNGTINNDSYPPVWEAPRALLDLQIAKKILKSKGELKLNISDLLNQTANYYHDLNDNGKFDNSNDALAIKRKYGTNVSISFGYNIK